MLYSSALPTHIPVLNMWLSEEMVFLCLAQDLETAAATEFNVTSFKDISKLLEKGSEGT